MEAKAYCSNMREEIISWKARIFDLTRKMDKRFTDSDKKSSGSIKTLSDMVEDLEKKIHKLEVECPADWSSMRADIDHVIDDMNKIWKESVELSPDDF